MRMSSTRGRSGRNKSKLPLHREGVKARRTAAEKVSEFFLRFFA